MNENHSILINSSERKEIPHDARLLHLQKYFYFRSMRITRMNAVVLARELRKNQTKSEQKVWSYLRNRKYRELKFLRQHPIYYGNTNGNTQFFIADFYCNELKWIIELDGPIHNNNKEYDKDRDKIISEKGIRVIRIPNEKVTNQSAFYEMMNSFINEYLSNR